MSAFLFSDDPKVRQCPHKGYETNIHKNLMSGAWDLLCPTCGFTVVAGAIAACPGCIISKQEAQA